MQSRRGVEPRGRRGVEPRARQGVEPQGLPPRARPHRESCKEVESQVTAGSKPTKPKLKIEEYEDEDVEMIENLTDLGNKHKEYLKGSQAWTTL